MGNLDKVNKSRSKRNSAKGKRLVKEAKDAKAVDFNLRKKQVTRKQMGKR